MRLMTKTIRLLALAALISTILMPLNVAVSEAVSLKPTAPDKAGYEAAIKAAMEFERAGKVQEALASYRLAMENDRTKAEPMARASMLYLILDKPTWAMDAASRAVLIEPDHRGAWLNKSVIELSGGLLNEALKTTQDALVRFPDDPELMSNMATAQLKLGDYEQAERTLKRALELRPEDSTTIYNLSCVYALTGNHKQSLTLLEQAISLDPALRQSAISDPDLDSISKLKRFKELTADNAKSDSTKIPAKTLK